MVHGGHPPLRIAIEMSGFGRHLTLRLTSGVALATLIAAGISLLSVLTTLLFLGFGDPILARLLRSDAALRAGYEDRIATLRYRIDHLASRQVLDRDTLEGTVQDLTHRQARLEMRHAMVANLVASNPISTTGSTSAAKSTGSSGHAIPTNVVAPPARAVINPQTVEKPKELGSNKDFAPSSKGFQKAQPETQVPQKRAETIRALDEKIASLEASQATTLSQLATAAVQESEKLTIVLSDLSLGIAGLPAKPARSAGRPTGDPLSGIGGPLIATDAGFEGTLAATRKALADTQRLRAFASRLPLSRPLAGDPEVSSGFGYRSDPFTRQSALHSGIDLKLEPGAPALAAGAGVVINAEYSGGYGNMVEIDHGNGITTRYGHLARIIVRDGMTVERGTPVGTVGSTGRSTGPHLHYETRIADEAVDPLRFLRAGERLRRMM